MANRFKEAPSEPKIKEVEQQTAQINEQKDSLPQKKGKLTKSLTTIFGGNFLGDESIIKQLPFIFFLSFVALFYIANGYWADDKIRQLNYLTNELKELHNEQISVKSALDFVKQEDQISPAAKKLGLIDCHIPPIKILVRDSLKTVLVGK